MAIPDGLTKVVTSGTLCGGIEKFAFGLWYDGYTEPPAAGSPNAPTWAGDTNYTAFLTAILPLMTASDAITQLDFYYYEGGEAVSHQTKVLTPMVGTGINVLPAQISLVYSLRTALATRRGRGRIYLPTRAGAISGPTGSFTGTAPAAIGAALVAHFNTVSTGDIVTPVVVSQTGGFATPLTAVSWDVTPDTQRRRRNKLSSVVTSVALA